MESFDFRAIAIMLAVIVIMIALSVWFLYQRKSCFRDPFENMEGDEFEDFCAQLLESQGFRDVELTQKSHDMGVDIFADRDGISYAIQCKCYSDPVGIKAIQEIYAGRDYYDCMVGVVMTNQKFTGPAIDFASKLNILMWDGDYIKDIIRQSGSNRKYQYISDINADYSEEE